MIITYDYHVPETTIQYIVVSARTEEDYGHYEKWNACMSIS